MLQRVLRAIQMGREQGFHFPGNFLAVSFDQVTQDKSLVSLKAESNAQGASADATALGVLVDLAMAASARAAVKRDTRLATVSMQLQLTNAPCTGPLEAESHFHGFVHEAAGKQAITSVTVRSGGREVCLGTATFMVLELPAGIRVPVLKAIDPSQFSEALPDPASDLQGHESAIYARAQAALAATGEDSGFFERFWGFKTRRNASGASATLKNGPHIGNRVGHVQGGVLLGFAQAAANAALPGQWSMTGITAGYVSPGEGDQLSARAKVVHLGRTTAVVRTEIFGVDKRRVLETVTTHSLRVAGAAP
jgi:uncharacterized protein (TIGR00369 family)